MDFLEMAPEPRFLPSQVDFMVDRKLMKKYAEQEDPTKPSLPQLIDLILRQAALENVSEPFLRVHRVSRVDVESRTFLTSRKNRAAKTVTLQMASALNWDLDKIEKDLSITMQFCLVQDLMNIVFSDTEYCSLAVDPTNGSSRYLSAFTADVLQPLPDHCIFGLTVYSRWILRAHIQRKVPKKPARGMIVNMAAITDPIVLQGLDQQAQGSSLIWNLFRQISRDKVSQSAVSILGSVVGLERKSFLVPLPDSFVIPSSTGKVLDDHHNWQHGQTITFAEFKIQILFDLARYWLFEGKMSKTLELLQQLLVCLKEQPVSTFQYIRLDVHVLVNMCKIVGCPASLLTDASLSAKPNSSLIPELFPSMKVKLIEALLEDLTVGRIPATTRSSLELEIRMSEENSERAYLNRVRLCNLLREYVAKLSLPSCAQIRSILSDAAPVDVEFLKTVMNSGKIHDDLREELIEKLTFLVEQGMLPQPVKVKVSEFLIDSPRSPSLSPLKQREDISMDVDNIPNTVQLQRIILTSYLFPDVKQAINQLSNLHPKVNMKDLDKSWSSKLPPTLKASCSTSWPPATLDLVIIIFAKSSELVENACYRSSRQILKSLRESLPAPPAKFDRNLRWQNTYTDLAESLQFINTTACTSDVKFEMIKRAKQCMTTALLKPPDEEPVPLYVQNIAVMVLFNFEEWDYITELISMQDQKRKTVSARSPSAIFPFLKQLILACSEYQSQREDLIAQSKGLRTKQTTVHRKDCMRLWNSLSAIFSVNDSSTKKPAASAPANLSQTVPTDVFWSYIKLLRHKKAAYLLFSCICRMWNVSTRDSGNFSLITEVFFPTTIPLNVIIPSGSLTPALETMFCILDECHVYDAEIMIIKGDYFFGKNDYSSAIKFYLLSAVGGTVPGLIHSCKIPSLSPGILRKMAVCFDNMQYFTYLAILCQLMDPVDYETAFRAVGERMTLDAADAAYDLIWDTLILQQLAFLLQKWGFMEKRQIVIDLLQNPVLTAANPPNVRERVILEKVTSFFELLFDQCVLG